MLNTRTEIIDVDARYQVFTYSIAQVPDLERNSFLDEFDISGVVSVNAMKFISPTRLSFIQKWFNINTSDPLYVLMENDYIDTATEAHIQMTLQHELAHIVHDDHTKMIKAYRGAKSVQDFMQTWYLPNAIAAREIKADLYVMSKLNKTVDEMTAWLNDVYAKSKNLQSNTAIKDLRLMNLEGRLNRDLILA